MSAGLRMNQKDFAEFINLTTRQVRRLTDEGMPSLVEGAERTYGPESHAWYLEKKLREEREKHAQGEREKLELEKLAHQNREARVKADLAERKAVLVEDVLIEWEEACGTIRSEIQRLPLRFGDVVRPDDPGAGEDLLEKVADDLLRAIQEAIAPPELVSDQGDVADAA